MARPDSKPITLEACAEYIADYARGERGREKTFNEGQAFIATLRREVEAVAARLIAPINLDDAEDSFLAQREIMEECSTRLTDALGEPKE